MNLVDPEGLAALLNPYAPSPLKKFEALMAAGKYKEALEFAEVMGLSASSIAVAKVAGDCTKQECDDKDDCKDRLSDWQIKNVLGINSHELKYEILGKKAKIALYELCKCKSGAIVVRFNGCKGPILDTGLSM